MANTGVIVTLNKDDNVGQIITTTVKALRRANKNKAAEEFQREVTSGKPMMTTIEKYVILAK